MILFYNWPGAATTLAAPLGPLDTTATLASGGGAGFSPGPTGGDYFCATLSDAATGLQTEIVHVTSIIGDTVTIVRAREGTIAQNWAISDTFEARVTAGSLEGLQGLPAPEAAKWSTPRNFILNGDGSATFTGVDGTANVTASFTLANVNTNIGSFGDSTHVGVFTVNAKGQVTAASTVAISFPAFPSNVATATAWQTARNFILNGDGSATFAGVNGTSNVTASFTLANTAVAPGAYQLMNATIDSKGRVTAASTPTPATVRTAAGMTFFQSSPINLSSSQSGSMAHGLNTGGLIVLEFMLQCSISDLGYSPGDLVVVSSTYVGSGTGRGYSVGYNSTTAFWARDVNGIAIQAKTGNVGDITLSRWSGFIRMIAMND